MLRATLISLAATLLPLATPAVASPSEPVLMAQARVSAAEAKSIAKRQVPGGEVVDISRRGDVYRVRIVARSGRVVDVFVDARSGRVVG